MEEVHNAERFVQNLEKIQLPNQLAAVLADPVLQKLLSLRKDDTTSRRVTNWMGSALLDVLEGNADTKGFVDIMEVLGEYVARVKVSPMSGLSEENLLTADPGRMFRPSF